jgi:transposase InsO family protein
VEKVFEDSKRTYGSPRIKHELQNLGIQESQSSVARAMKTLGLMARPRRKFVHTTDSKHRYKVADNLLNRNFEASQINEKWVSDITYIRTQKGWVYLTVILDLADRMVVAWNVSEDLSCENTVLKAYKIALIRRKISRPLIFHSDKGVQYCSINFRRILNKSPLVSQSMSRKGNCWDNAVMESFFKTLKVEWINNHQYQNIEMARKSIFDYIERWYNTLRKHSANNFLSPAQKHFLLINRKVA